MLPLQFKDGVTRESLGLKGDEGFDIVGIAGGIAPGMDVDCTIRYADGATRNIALLCRIDTADEVAYSATAASCTTSCATWRQRPRALPGGADVTTRKREQMPDAEIQSLPDFGFGRRDPAAGLNGADAAITTRPVGARLPARQAGAEGIDRAYPERGGRAPSGTNVQPWHVTVVTGAARDRIGAAIHERRDGGGGQELGYNYYPVKWFEPYISRRRKLGWDMYGLLGIAKGERDKTYRQHGRNFDFFDAPVGLFFHMDRRMEVGSFIDMGLFLENAMVSARGHGLDTCPQAAWVDYSDSVKSELGIPEDHILICGMSLGYEDTSAPVNALYSERELPASSPTGRVSRSRARQHQVRVRG